MSRDALNNHRVLAIDPCTQGFGLAVLEGADQLIAYEIKEAKGDKNDVCLKKIADLMKYYQPDVVVLENPTGEGSRRSARVQKLIGETMKLASIKKIKTRRFSRSQIRRAFSSSEVLTKHQIASAIARQLPEIASKLPKPRKSWQSENERMNIFDAISLALCFYLRIEKELSNQIR